MGRQLVTRLSRLRNPDIRPANIRPFVQRRIASNTCMILNRCVVTIPHESRDFRHIVKAGSDYGWRMVMRSDVLTLVGICLWGEKLKLRMDKAVLGQIVVIPRRTGYGSRTV